MITPELKGLLSVDLERPHLPEDPDDCEIEFAADIGPAGAPGADIFRFTVATPKALSRETRFRWVRGLLLVPVFSWQTVDLAFQRLPAHCARPTWDEVARELNKRLLWEFDNYCEYTGS